MKHKLLIACMLCFFMAKSENQCVKFYFYSLETNWVDSATISINQFTIQQPIDEITNPILKLIKKKQHHNQRIISAILAFPFPFGIVGLHRIFLGTKPHVPVAYIATFGGVFGLLPLIDFLILVFDKNFENYQQNGQVFMWVKP